MTIIQKGERMSDLISRQAAIDALNEQIEQCNKALGSFDISFKDEFAIKVERASLKAYKEQLENLPTVQLKRGKKWVWNGDTLDWERLHYCSECKKYALRDTDGKEVLSDFCPRCGADMRGEADECN